MPEHGTLDATNIIVCWSRMQAEAGQGLAKIVARKEIERKIGSGTFFWGVGNPPSTAIASLSEIRQPIEVLFSIMKTPPKPQDVSPARIQLWLRYVRPDGVVCELPEHVLVTSRTNSRKYHYALQCHSDKPLALSDFGPFDPKAHRNVSGTGGKIGASQVTALVRQVKKLGSADYRINLRAFLTGGYWVKLIDPVEITARDRILIDKFNLDKDSNDWKNLVKRLRSSANSEATASSGRSSILQPGLFDEKSQHSSARV